MDDYTNKIVINTDDLIAACNSLGELDVNDGVYMKDRDCKSCLKEIIRALNNDNKQHTIRCMLGSLNIIKSDIIPLINQYCDFNHGDQELFNLILRLCTNLTSSVLLLFEHQEIPNTPEATKLYNSLTMGLVNYKKAFAYDSTIWNTLNVHLRHTEEEVVFERLLILIRNILHIPVDSSADFGLYDELNTHDMILNWLDKSGMLQTIVEIASETQKGTEFCFHLMEIVYLMLRDKNPITIASAQFINNNNNSSQNKRKRLDDDDVDKKRLAELRARDKSSRVAARVVAPRFTRGSTFVVQNVCSLGDAPAITDRLLTSKDSIVLDEGKTELRKRRDRKPFDSEKSSTVLSDRVIRPSKVDYSLKMFCKQFTEKIYANYMQQIKHNLIQKKAAENDESYYLWAIQFFLTFNKHLFMSLDNISETLSTSTLHFIQILINDYQDKLKIEKKRTKIEMISKRLHLAIRAYKEILTLIKSIQVDSEFSSLKEQIKKKIFTETEYCNMILILFQQYDESKHCPDYVKDLIRANEIFLSFGKEFQSMSQYYCLDILIAYASVLKQFKTNDSNLNLSILTYFEQLAYDYNLAIMLLQASILNNLLEIVDDTHMIGHERFVALTKELASKFVSLVADRKRWMYQELLFWKSHNDCLEIEHDPREEQIITAKTVDDLDFIVPDNNDDDAADAAADGEKERVEDEQILDQGGLSPLSQISGVDDMDDLFNSSLSDSNDDDGDQVNAIQRDNTTNNIESSPPNQLRAQVDINDEISNIVIPDDDDEDEAVQTAGKSVDGQLFDSPSSHPLQSYTLDNNEDQNDVPDEEDVDEPFRAEARITNHEKSRLISEDSEDDDVDNDAVVTRRAELSSPSSRIDKNLLNSSDEEEEEEEREKDEDKITS